jgi:hypothetical protein
LVCVPEYSLFGADGHNLPARGRAGAVGGFAYRAVPFRLAISS